MKDTIKKILKDNAWEMEKDRYVIGLSNIDDIAEEVIKLFLIPPVIGSLPCNHNYNQVDTYWNRCTHCGMYAPLGQ